jgi:hypothetical protein
MDKRKIIMLVIGLLILIGALFGLTMLSNVTGNVITGGAIDNDPVLEQESFKINNNVNDVEVIDGSQNSG